MELINSFQDSKNELETRLNQLFNLWNKLNQMIALNEQIVEESISYQILLAKIDEEERWYVFKSLSLS